MYYFGQHCLLIKARSNDSLETGDGPWDQKTFPVIFKNLLLAFSAALARQLLLVVVVWTPNLSIWRLVLPKDPRRGRLFYPFPLFRGLSWQDQVLLIPRHSFGWFKEDSLVTYGPDWDSGKHLATHRWCCPTSWKPVPSWFKWEFNHLSVQWVIKCFTG